MKCIKTDKIPELPLDNTLLDMRVYAKLLLSSGWGKWDIKTLISGLGYVYNPNTNRVSIGAGWGFFGGCANALQCLNYSNPTTPENHKLCCKWFLSYNEKEYKEWRNT